MQPCALPNWTTVKKVYKQFYRRYAHALVTKCWCAAGHYILSEAFTHRDPEILTTRIQGTD